jgi:transposase InsO family protein
MKEHRRRWRLRLMCRVLEVSPSGYYAWCRRRPSPRFHRRSQWRQAIQQAHLSSRRTYGSPRVTAVLRKDGLACCVNTVAKIMREDGLAAKVKRRFKVTTDSDHDLPVAPNRLDRDFVRSRPNEVWVSDITFIATEEGWLYLAAALDLYSRRIVGWAMGERITSELVTSALEMAVVNRQPPPGLMHHSDRGCQYASASFGRMLKAHGMVCSMSRKANAYDNAVMESFFGTLKRELIHRDHYASRDEAKKAVFEWIEVFYNRQRLHSSLGYRSPAEFESHRRI